MAKTKVAVIFGGKSKEHDVSLMSASNVIEAMDKEKYDIQTIGIDKTGGWHLYKGDPAKIKDGRWIEEEAFLTDVFSVFDTAFLKEVDVFFPILHGPNGEDGTLQGLLTLTGKPYVGCGVLASAVGMDKGMCKKVFAQAAIPQGDYLEIKATFWKKSLEAQLNRVEEKIGFPCFIKPANMGSSVGISKAETRDELKRGIEEAFAFDRKIVVEKAVNCREIECAVLGNDEPQASVLGEILPSKTFYDYEAKYLDGNQSGLVIPADLSGETTQAIRDYAVRAYQALDCSGLARVDFFVEKDTGEIFINEINTMPGFTNISMYPKLWGESGIAYPDLIDRLIDLAFERQES